MRAKSVGRYRPPNGVPIIDDLDTCREVGDFDSADRVGAYEVAGDGDAVPIGDCGNDHIYGGDDTDQLFGGEGDDTITVNLEDGKDGLFMVDAGAGVTDLDLDSLVLSLDGHVDLSPTTHRAHRILQHPVAQRVERKNRDPRAPGGWC